MIPSPLRYPGGKTRFVQRLIQHLPSYPDPIREYREPMVGGGSLFLAIRQKMPEVPCWINDIDDDLIEFWLVAQQDPDALIRLLMECKNTYRDGRELYQKLIDTPPADGENVYKAARYFALHAEALC